MWKKLRGWWESYCSPQGQLVHTEIKPTGRYHRVGFPGSPLAGSKVTLEMTAIANHYVHRHWFSKRTRSNSMYLMVVTARFKKGPSYRLHCASNLNVTLERAMTEGVRKLEQRMPVVPSHHYRQMTGSPKNV